MKKTGSLFVLLLFAAFTAWGQNIDEFLLDATTHQTVRPMGNAGMRIFDDGGSTKYTNGVDYWVTITGSCDSPYVMEFSIEVMDLRMRKNGMACADTLFIYDGPTINDSLLWIATGITYHPNTRRIYPSPNNTTGAVTVRFKSCDCSNIDASTGEGFSIQVDCQFPCESYTPYIDTIFYKTRNGEIYDFGRIKTLYDTMTVLTWDSILMDSVPVIDSIPFRGVNLCLGDGVIFTSHCDYSHNSGWYTPSDSTSTFTWSMGTGDSIIGVGKTSVYYEDFFKVSCYDVILSVVDEKNCASAVYPSVRVRMAQNPLKTLFTLQEICSRDSLFVNMGYDGDNATLTLRTINYTEVSSKTNDALTFIPDGPNCPIRCFWAPVVFDEFPSGMTVTDKKDICSICVNYEHSYMGDYSLAIRCPTQQKAYLKFKDNPPYATPEGTRGGGGRFTGMPYGGSNFLSGDKRNGDNCDSTQNYFGIGWNYCFSRNGDYTLVSGEPASTPMPTNAGMASTPNGHAQSVTFPPTIPMGYGFVGEGGPSCGTVSYSNVLDSSDYANMSGYYIPGDDFSQLVGCPLNGKWEIEICDALSRDNGWVFQWSMDICGVNQSDCKYQVGIDSLIWEADTSEQYCDYELGHYRGAEVHRHSDIEAYILTPDTAGTFRINVTIFDEFGCVWDTNTNITSRWTPAPYLGPDTALCGVYQAHLDASDRHSNLPGENFLYLWSPFGQTTDTISTAIEPGRDIQYVVEVQNDHPNKVCVTRDTIDIFLRRQPYPSFVPTPFTLEGCDPLTLTFDNQSIDGYKHYWDFGDGNTSDLASPTHSYSEGLYDLKYYVVSEDGCEDSLIYSQAIAVYKAPKAAFSWEPVYPSVLMPEVQFTNKTQPHDDATRYFWEIQYSKDYPLSVQTITEENPSFDFSQYASQEDIAGNYVVRLIARSDNRAPSGNLVYCRDTSENTILMVNDFLQFPNVVTPNGDGINDRFVIVNLIGGMGYPINTLDIYNKWGTRVYHRENIASEEDFWDPSDVPEGTYFYRFSAKGYNGNVEHNGAVEVVKQN